MPNPQTHRIRKAELSPEGITYLEIAGKAILLYQIDQGYQAISATCTHEKFEMDAECVYAGMLLCPLHGARFDLRTGKCLRGPASADLKSYRVTEMHDETHEVLMIEFEVEEENHL